ncbi:hypothetical protein F2P81_010941 [Scophthalmus maximus]|uniref:Uncharacterized protein n=1 Tax=Scophthalmus maximus TaxID=52904 RepID=A0A6A4SSH5_SCOMX|nr:hypothetical protein F2P81_010941 [Scophthalmus maximus]
MEQTDFFYRCYDQKNIMGTSVVKPAGQPALFTLDHMSTSTSSILAAFGERKDAGALKRTKEEAPAPIAQCLRSDLHATWATTVEILHVTWT